MKTRLSARHESGLTLFEVGVVVAVLMILVVLLLSSIPSLDAHARARKINCINNLKHVGVAYRIWEGDNGDMYPMGISITNHGSMEAVQTGNIILTFQVMSNELSTPRILYCPADTDRYVATDFGGLANSNISYLVSVDVTNDTNPQSILSGDCNFEMGGKPVKSGLVSLWTNDPVVWSAARHVRSGILCLADGSVQTAPPSSLHHYLVQTRTATNRLAIP